MKTEDVNARLRKVVSSYGADPRHWPADEIDRLSAAARISQDADWMIEAKALDALLGEPTDRQVGGALTGAILTKAATTAQMQSGVDTEFGQVIDFTPTQENPPLPSPKAFPGIFGLQGRGLANLPEAAVLAASLLIGVWVGGSGVADTVTSWMDVEYGFSGTGEDEANLINALSGFSPGESEDLL